jgi:FkbM family methyltransferase
MEDHDLLRFVDVGALGGLDKKLSAHRAELWPVLFEPNRTEAALIETHMAGYQRHSVVARGLGDIDGPGKLFKTRNPTCYSILSPNMAYLKQYGISYHFALEGSEDIILSRYDTLYKENLVPLPDALKIDVQGFEYQVLLGFGDLLSNVVAIKLETHFYQIYESQKLFGDLIHYLSKFGLVLRKIDCDKLEHFAGDVVEVDAYFSKDRRAIRALPQRMKEKFEILALAWDLPVYDYTLP